MAAGVAAGGEEGTVAATEGVDVVTAARSTGWGGVVEEARQGCAQIGIEREGVGKPRAPAGVLCRPASGDADLRRKVDSRSPSRSPES